MAQSHKQASHPLRFIFAKSDDGPDLRFVEIENARGESVQVGTWSTDDDRGYSVLSVDVNSPIAG